MADLPETPDRLRTEPSKRAYKALPPFFAVSLHEAFRVFALERARSIPLHRGRTTLRQRTAARLKEKDRSLLTLLDIVDDTIGPAYPGDIEAEDRARFVHDLRFGTLPAIGYLSPRTEQTRQRLIPMDVWINGQLDWDRAEVCGAGLSFTHVQILMSDNFPEARGTDVYGEPLPDLAPFEPSEEMRLRWGIPAGARESDAATPPHSAGSHTVVPEDENAAPVRTGRPSHKFAINQAFEELKPHDAMTDKQLFQAIRDWVKTQQGSMSDKGLGDSAIQKHVIQLRKEERTRKN